MNGREYIIKKILNDSGDTPATAGLYDTGWCGGGGVTARFAVTHDGGSLRVLLEASEPEPRGTVTDPFNKLTDDSCLGLILAPAGDARYMCFAFNPLGTMELSLGTGRSGRVRMAPGAMAPFNLLPFREGKDWGVTFRVPLDFLRLFFPDFDFRGEAGGAVFKCGELSARRHCLLWPEAAGESPDIPRAESLGKFIFE